MAKKIRKKAKSKLIKIEDSYFRPEYIIALTFKGEKTCINLTGGQTVSTDLSPSEILSLIGAK